MKRKRLTKAQRLDVFHAHGGRCYDCGEVINLARGETFEVEHRVALGLGGADDPSNWRPIHPECHAVKTKADVTAIAKAKRVSAKHTGTYRKPRHQLPGGRSSPLKKKLNGLVVRRSPDDQK